MTQYQIPGEPPIPLLLRRSARARRISLRVSQLDGRVTLTLPARLPEAEALDFAREKEAWIRKHLSKRPPVWTLEDGAQLPIEGTLRTLRLSDDKGIHLGPDALTLPRDKPGSQLQRYLKALARDRFAEATDHYARKLGKHPSRITLRDTRSRWGSCSSQGALMFSWRLILAPTDVLRYVAAHEVAHLKEMNHSSAFWGQVERLFGSHESQRKWLRTRGPELHRYILD
jgi:predicted metal-dependent hydrolase